MTTAVPKTDLLLTTEAIGAHGIFFKKSLRDLLETIPGLRILGEEYPVRYLEGASIDLLVEYKSLDITFVLPIECKRALATMKKWIFFRDSVTDAKFLYILSGANLSVARSSSIKLAKDICIEGVEVDTSKLRGNVKSPHGAASADRIWEAAFQVCKGGHGFLQAELQARVKQPATPTDFQLFLLIVTTAPLQIAELPPGCIDLPSGSHKGELKASDVPWLVLNYPFTPPSTLGSQHLQVNSEGYIDPMLRGMHSKEGIMIVNAQHVVRFFEHLRNGSTA